MYLESMVLENFGPYYGRHELDLSVSDMHPVIVVHGENMRGKTSLFNALRWVLYGRALSRQKQLLAPLDLFNSVAFEEAAEQCSVVLTYEVDEKKCVASRRLLRDGRGNLSERFKLQVGSTVVSADAADENIASLMDESISRFFFFDGEMLGEYERLLADTTTEATTVRDSIESILGLPALRHLADDLSTLAVEAYQRQSKRSAAEKKADQAAALHAQKSALLAQTEESLRTAEAKVISLNRKSQAISDQLSALGETKVTIERIANFVRRREENVKAVDECRVQIQGILRERWWFPVGARIDGRLVEVRTKLRAASARDARLNSLRESERNLSESLRNTNCDTCGQPLPAARLEPIKARLDEVRGEIAELMAPVSPSVSELLAMEDQLRPFTRPPEATRIRDLELRLRKLQQEIRIINQDISELESTLRGHEEAEVRAKQISYDETVRTIGRLNGEIREMRERKSKLQKELRQLQRKVAARAGAGDSGAQEQALLQTLADVFERSIARFRDALRKEVEAEASRIFLRLTTEKEYQGLVINEQYGLRILDEAGGVLRVRSAGAEQIVALTLIGALNECAVRRGPLVMDTPFGRLDEGHRANILRWAPEVSRQVILLVQSGEIDPTGTLLAKIKPSLNREYRIVRDGSPRKSKLEVVRG